MWVENDKIDFRLSSLERLAKEVRPSFTYVIKVNDDLEIVEAYLIHMMGDVLAFVLGKLREKQADGRFAVNKAEVSLQASKIGKKIEPTGAALLTELNAIVQGDMNAYIDMKRNKLATLGFEPFPHELKFTMHLDNPDDLLEAFLGLKSSVRISNVENYETRFGIKIKAHDLPSEGSLRFDPIPADRCTLTFRKQASTKPIVFEADVYFVPPAMSALEGGTVALMKSESFSMLLKKGKVNFKIPETSGDAPKLEIGAWIKHFRLIMLLQGGNFSMDIQPSRKKKFRMELNEGLFKIDVERVEFYLNCAENFQKLCTSAGVPSNIKVGLRVFVEQASTVQLMCGFIENQEFKTPLSFTAEDNGAVSTPDAMNGLYLDYVIVGSDVVVIVVDAFVKRVGEEGKLEYQSEALSFRDIDVIEAESYESYTKTFGGLSGNSFVFSRGQPMSDLSDRLGGEDVLS